MTSLLPDPAAIAEQLEHARGTREHLDRVIAWLEQGLELVGAPPRERDHEPLPGPPGDDAAVPQRALEASSMRDPEYSPPAASDSAASSEEANPEPSAPDEVPAPTETLPIVEREPEQDPVIPPDLAATPVPARRSPPSRTTARDVEAKIVSAVISSNMPLSLAQIAERTGMTKAQLKPRLQPLVAAGKVQATGATVSRRYTAGEHEPHSEAGRRTTAGRERNAAKLTDAVGRVGLRDRVMKAITADPAALDNRRLALALDADLADIADACEFLVGKGRVQMADDGSYLRSVAEAAREYAAA